MKKNLLLSTLIGLAGINVGMFIIGAFAHE